MQNALDSSSFLYGVGSGTKAKISAHFCAEGQMVSTPQECPEDESAKVSSAEFPLALVLGAGGGGLVLVLAIAYYYRHKGKSLVYGRHIKTKAKPKSKGKINKFRRYWLMHPSCLTTLAMNQNNIFQICVND